MLLMHGGGLGMAGARAGSVGLLLGDSVKFSGPGDLMARSGHLTCRTGAVLGSSAPRASTPPKAGTSSPGSFASSGLSMMQGCLWLSVITSSWLSIHRPIEPIWLEFFSDLSLRFSVFLYFLGNLIKIDLAVAECNVIMVHDGASCGRQNHL